MSERKHHGRVIKRLDRPYKTVTLSEPIKAYGKDVRAIRLYKPKLGDLVDWDLRSMGEKLTIGQLLPVLSRIGRDEDGDPMPDGWEEELDFNDLQPTMEVVVDFLGSGPTTGGGSPATSD